MCPLRARHFRFILILLTTGMLMAAAPIAPTVAQGSAPQRFFVRARGAADYAALRAELAQSGSTFILDRPDLNWMVVSVPNVARARAESSLSLHAASVAPDQVEDLLGPIAGAPAPETSSGPALPPARTVMQGPEFPAAPGSPAPFIPDPALSLTGLLWNMQRIRAPLAWQQPVGLGEPYVLVGVVDTGLDYTDIELQNKVVRSVDFTLTEDPPVCTGLGYPSDAQLATAFGAPGSDEDFNGHGTTIGGIIAARINLTGTNGIAPQVGLASLKVAQNCGLAYDSSIISAILYAADNGIDVLNLSFSHYLDRSSPAQDTIYQAYTQAVDYARSHGTVVVASAGDEHTRIGDGGKVIGHGVLSAPPGGIDNFGLWQVPGGIAGVVDVSSTNNVVNGSSATCPADSLAAGMHQWCKPASDAHQPKGAGGQNQLAYYSNYGPRIDLAAPGGARKFNLPDIDRGGAEGWPWTGVNSIESGTSVPDGHNAWQVFSITSDFATRIPCFTFSNNAVFPSNQCYAIQEGSGLAAAHVSAVLAVTASRRPALWHKPDLLVAYVKSHVRPLSGNSTTQASASDTTAGDRIGGACTGGYCHLGSTAIPDVEAYGTGLVDAYGPFWPAVFLPAIIR